MTQLAHSRAHHVLTCRSVRTTPGASTISRPSVIAHLVREVTSGATGRHFGRGFDSPRPTYAMIKMHRTLKMTPALEAGVTDTLWSMRELVALVDAFDATLARMKPGQKAKQAANS